MSITAFPIHPDYTAVSIAYKNPRYIADEVLPRVAVASPEFTYMKYDLSNFKIPDLNVGRTSATPRDNLGATETTGTVADYGLEIPVPQKDIDSAPAGTDVLGKATVYISEKLATAREKRVADVVFNAANYKATTNKATLSGATQWSHADSDPIKAIMDAMDGMVMRPNTMVIGRGAFSALIRNAKIVSAMHGNSGQYGVATKQWLMELFELEAVLVGESFIDSAKKGQASSLSRCWGKHCALVYRGNVNGGENMSFGFTGQFGDRVAAVWEDRNIGLRGGQIVRVGESVKELLTADDLGFLFTDAAA